MLDPTSPLVLRLPISRQCLKPPTQRDTPARCPRAYGVTRVWPADARVLTTDARLWSSEKEIRAC